MNPIKKYLLAFLVGVAIGSFLVLALYYIARERFHDDKDVALETLDFLIDEWTAQREPNDTLQLAQIPARIELPNARPGFFPDTVRILAQWIELKYQIPKGVTLAQWALESAWGRNNLNVSNYFGHTFNAVKPFLDNPTWVIRPEKTTRNGMIVRGKDVRFASYKNIAECFEVHGKYLSRSPRYASAFATESSIIFARKLAEAGYAEDDEYGLKLIAIIKRYRI